MDFELWWFKNKDLYTLVKVTKEVAKAIWNDAQAELEKEISQILKEHE